MKILSFGDLFLGGKIVDDYPNFDQLFSKELLEYIYSADLRIANLESPIMKSELPNRNLGPWPEKLLQVAPERMVKLLKFLKIDYVSLANNHLFDYGQQGLEETINILEKNNILHSGGGTNLEKAIKPAIVEFNGNKIGIFSFSEYNKPYLKMVIPADENSYGINPLNMNSIKKAADIAKKLDFNISCLHWGREYLEYPSPEQYKIAEKIFDNNFDLILGNHSHIPMKIDYINNKAIVFSHGNFIFDKFYYDNPAQIINYPSDLNDKKIRKTKLLPGNVSDLTLKEWGKKSRISLISEIELDIDSYDIIDKYIIFDQDDRIVDFLDEERIIKLKNKLYSRYDYKKEFNKWGKYMENKQIKQLEFRYDSFWKRKYKINYLRLNKYLSKFNWFVILKEKIKNYLIR